MPLMSSIRPFNDAFKLNFYEWISLSIILPLPAPFASRKVILLVYLHILDNNMIFFNQLRYYHQVIINYKN